MKPAPDETRPPKYLFGGSRPWLAADWTSSDDRVRGGRSISHLVVVAAAPPGPSSPPSPPSPPSPSATFTGTLDARALGGAGFASQRTTAADLGLDLAAYPAGIALDIARADGKTYTLVLRDAVLPPSRADGRERSTVGWEADFTPTATAAADAEEAGAGVRTLLRWEDFKPTYRGREKRDAGELNRADVKRVSLMCRSFFGEQEGDFELVIRSISAVAEELGPPYRDDPDGGTLTDVVDEKRDSAASTRQGWLSWIFSACVKL